MPIEMDEHQLRIAMQYDPIVKFGGVYSFDEIPNVLQPDHFYVFNTAPSWHPGAHWVSVYAGYHVEFFDSLARNVTLEQFREILKDRYNSNSTTPVQHPLSSACGYYCLFYIFMRCRGMPLDCIEYVLCDWDNEQYVINFIKDVYCI